MLMIPLICQLMVNQAVVETKEFFYKGNKMLIFNRQELRGFVEMKNKKELNLELFLPAEEARIYGKGMVAFWNRDYQLEMSCRLK